MVFEGQEQRWFSLGFVFDFNSSLNQVLNDFQITFLGGHMKGRIPMWIPYVHIGSIRDKQIVHFFIAKIDGQN